MGLQPCGNHYDPSFAPVLIAITRHDLSPANVSAQAGRRRGKSKAWSRLVRRAALARRTGGRKWKRATPTRRVEAWRDARACQLRCAIVVETRERWTEDAHWPGGSSPNTLFLRVIACKGTRTRRGSIKTSAVMHALPPGRETWTLMVRPRRRAGSATRRSWPGAPAEAARRRPGRRGAWQCGPSPWPKGFKISAKFHSNFTKFDNFGGGRKKTPKFFNTLIHVHTCAI